MQISLVKVSVLVGAILTGAGCGSQKNMVTSETSRMQANELIFGSDVYSVFTDRVIQGGYTATALSSEELTSDYQSPANLFQSPAIQFKFSINGKDNEMISGKDHHLNVLTQSKEFVSPIIKFGQQFVDKSSVAEGTFVKPDTKLTLRLDLREVLDGFKSKGFYTAFNGDKIYKEDFKGVYVAGSAKPLTWDFDNLVNHPHLQLHDKDNDGIYEVDLLMNRYESQSRTASSWKLSKDISAFPQYKSESKLADALYKMALEEMQNAVEPDSTFRTGKEWAGVWTRDISYSIILSMASLQPQVAVNSLLRKVKNDRVIQDTGTGGSYPVSSDRMIWAVAAWEVFKTNGDREWLTKAFNIIKNSVDDDLKNVYDPITGLVKGESSFLDWREQTYPKWMQSADIYESECLGTNAVHYQVNVVLSEMAKLLGDNRSAQKYGKLAEGIRAGINKYLWMPEKGYYGQFLYGRNHKILSPRAEALGEALTVLFGIADKGQQKRLVESTPVGKFGISCIYPQIPNIPPYHNNGVWPFAESYWALAAAKAGNESSVVRSMAGIYRPGALFLTTKENFVAQTGDFEGTQINSSNMLWSLSGNIGLIHKILFGIDIQTDRLVFNPFVPKVLQGRRSLNNFKYRKAVLDIEMEGYGNEISSITMDGKALSNAELPATLEGKHAIQIVLANNSPGGKVNVSPDYFSPAVPLAKYLDGHLQWESVENAVKYEVIKNGQKVALVADTKIPVKNDTYGEYQVIAVDPEGVESFASEPVPVYPSNFVRIIEAEKLAAKADYPYQGFSGRGFVEIGKQTNRSLKIEVIVPEGGLYAIDFRYANGNGPTNTENKCAIRTLNSEKGFMGTVVLPQRGKEEWSNWGFSNAVSARLEKGKNVFSLSFEPQNENMNGEVNQAMIDFVRFTKIGE
mgnify:CR=1 FL=1